MAYKYFDKRLDRQEQESLRIKNSPMDYINLSLENFKGLKYNIWGVDLVDVQLISK